MLCSVSTSPVRKPQRDSRTNRSRGGSKASKASAHTALTVLVAGINKGATTVIFSASLTAPLEQGGPVTRFRNGARTSQAESDRTWKGGWLLQYDLSSADESG